LSDVNFSNADLSYANLEDTILIGADFFGAKLEGANLQDVDIGIEGYTLVKKNSICKQKFS
jgi:uncharacterized protein YjbI with pentapeptide repeats